MPARPSLQAVLFDLDGTLLDSAPDLAAAVDHMRVARGLHSLPLSSYRPFTGSGARGMLQAAFGMAPTHPDFEAMKEEFFGNYAQCLTQRTTAFSGVTQLVTALVGKSLQWGVVTNKSQRFTDPLTAAMPLFDSAGAIVSGDTTAYAKPHPAPLLEAARRLGVSPERCMYVGDDERDIVAGKAAGMLTVAACYGYLGDQAQVGAWGADMHINAPIELLRCLDVCADPGT